MYSIIKLILLFCYRYWWICFHRCAYGWYTWSPHTVCPVYTQAQTNITFGRILVRSFSKLPKIMTSFRSIIIFVAVNFRLYAVILIRSADARPFLSASADDEDSIVHYANAMDFGDGLRWWLYDSHRWNSTIFMVERVILAATLAVAGHHCRRV